MLSVEIAQENRLGGNRSEVAALGFEDVDYRAIDRFGLHARIDRFGGGLAAEKEFPGLGALHPAQDDRAAMGLDRFDRRREDTEIR